MGRVTLIHVGDPHSFAPGDILSTGDMVLGVDHAGHYLAIGKATWWRRARFWLRAVAIDSWRWLRCTLADGWDRLTEGEP